MQITCYKFCMMETEEVNIIPTGKGCKASSGLFVSLDIKEGMNIDDFLARWEISNVFKFIFLSAHQFTFFSLSGYKLQQKQSYIYQQGRKEINWRYFQADIIN